MPSVDSFNISPSSITCGSVVKMDVSATFATSNGGFVTVRVGGDNQCYFVLAGGKLTDRITVRIPSRSGPATIRNALSCHESGDTAVALVATAEDEQGTSPVPRRRTLLVTGC
jgi:hypothetical protein